MMISKVLIGEELKHQSEVFELMEEELEYYDKEMYRWKV